MKKVVIIVFLLNILIYSIICAQNTTLDTCNILHGILGQKHLHKILDLDNSEIKSVYIRAIDLTGTFKNCAGYYSLIPYFTVDAISPNINTGLYRDLVIMRIEYLNKILYADIYCADFKGDGNLNTNYHLKLGYRIKSDGKAEFVKEELAEWHDGPPPVDYENLKH